MYDRARAAGLKVVAGTILPFDTALPLQNVKMEALNAWIAFEAARGGHVTLADTRAAVARAGDIHRLDGSPDGLHPDVEGYRRMALAIDAAISRHTPST
jgi:lysophospholipase L1-like esterase